MTKNYTFDISLTWKGQRLHVLCSNSKNSEPRHLFSIKGKNNLLKYAKLKEYKSLMKDAPKEYFSEELITTLYKHIKNQEDPALKFKFIFPFTYLTSEEIKKLCEFSEFNSFLDD